MDLNFELCLQLHAASVAAVAALTLLQAERKRKQRRFGVHPINRTRTADGHYPKLYKLLRKHEDRFFNHLRVSTAQFDELTKSILPHLRRRDVKFHQPFPVEMKVMITLRYLATGDQMSTMALNFRIGRSTCRGIVIEICEALWFSLKQKYLKTPTKEDFLEISKGFLTKWGLPHCLGAVDGKHIPIKTPINSSAEYFCYKKHFSIVIMAICDADYNFTFVEIGHFGSESDAGSGFGDAILTDKLDTPENNPLPLTNIKMKYYFVGDEYFPLKENLMIPYAKAKLADRGASDSLKLMRRVFNYRLSRARRTIENSFGILANRWRILHTTIEAYPETAKLFVQACVILHNFVMKTKDLGDAKLQKKAGFNGDVYSGQNLVQKGTWRFSYAKSNLWDFQERSNRNPAWEQKLKRDQLAEYFSNVLRLPYQENYVNHNTPEFRSIPRRICRDQ